MRLALPKGRLYESTKMLLEKSGIHIYDDKSYKPKTNIEGLELYVLKPRNIPKMVEQGLVDAGIVGIDLVKDEDAKVVEILDVNTMPVYLIMAVKESAVKSKDKITVASEYEHIAKQYLDGRYQYNFIKTYGATECFVPDFADAIIDHVQTGNTLRNNGLSIVDIIMKSTTHLIANSESTKSVEKSAQISDLERKLREGMKEMPKEEGFLDEQKIISMMTYKGEEYGKKYSGMD